jgi:hypothetical protein
MERLSSRVVTLKDREIDALRTFDEVLERGASIAVALNVTRMSHPGLSEDFYRYLGGQP